MKRIYMYSLYERIWHWGQAIAILLLIWTGMEIHFPHRFGVWDFALAVEVHKLLAFFVILNALLSLFYHVATGEIRQFLPEPKDFITMSIQQAVYYMKGMFQGKPHPFEKHPQKKLNPLQKMTYLGILNFLLPLQVLSGILLWGAAYWPGFIDHIGGLRTAAVLHASGVWLFLAFIVGHIYMTTTGERPLTYIKAMITGWEEVHGEAHGSQETKK